jgi:hypothetical protein
VREQLIKRVVNETSSKRRRIVVHLACGHTGSIGVRALGNFGPLLLMGSVRSWPCPVCPDPSPEELVREVVLELADALQIAVLLAERCDDADLRRVIYRAAQGLQRLQPKLVPEPDPPPVSRRPHLTASRS